MFSSLEEEIEHAQQESPTTAQRVFRLAAITAISILIFGGLVLGIMLLEF